MRQFFKYYGKIIERKPGMNWIAVNESGYVYMQENKHTACDEVWVCDGGHWFAGEHINLEHEGIDWRETLVKIDDLINSTNS